MCCYENVLAIFIPAYCGVVTVFYDGLICANSPYPKPWSYRVRRTLSDWDGTVWYREKATIWLDNQSIKAMNPAHILYEAQTNTVWGRGFQASQLDMQSFAQAANQLFDERFGLCLAWRRQEKLGDFIQHIIDTIGALLYLDRTTGLWKLVLIRDNYNPELLPLYDYSNGLLRITDDSNPAQDVAANQTVLSYKDPISNEDKSIRAENIAAIQQHGVISETKNYAGLPSAALAGRIAARDMKINQSNLKRFKLVFDRRAFAMQPMQVFKLSLPEQHIESIVLRAIKVEHDSITNGEISVTALQDVFGLPSTNVVQAQNALWQPPNHQVERTNQAHQLQFIDPCYYDLCAHFEPVPRTYSSGMYFYFAAMVKEPNPLHLQFKLWLRHRYYKRSLDAIVDTGFMDVATIGNYCPVATLIDALPFSYEPASVRIDINLEKLKLIQIGSAAMIGGGRGEIVRVDHIDLATSTITLSRGCADSLPLEHLANHEIWFYEDAIAISSKMWERQGGSYTDDDRGSYEQIYYKIQNITRYDETVVTLLDEIDVFKEDFTSLIPRTNKPYPPAYVLINEQMLLPYLQLSQFANDSIYINYVSPLDFTYMTWRHRNRLIQADQLLAQHEPSVEGGLEGESLSYYVMTYSFFKYYGWGSGWTGASVPIDLGDTTSMYFIDVMPDLHEHSKLNFTLRTRNPLNVSLHQYMYRIEFFGFGMNFGNHFGAYNEH